LRTQINPHFLFNSLNSISALTAIDAAGARDMTIELAQFFRQTLALSEKQKIPLSDEIALCNHFLAIEKIRFGKKLQVQMRIDPDSENCLLPPMLLQPLLENAIKHGIRDLVDGGTIELSSKVRAPWLFVAIDNPVDIHPSSTQGTGTGLKNLQARLRSLYSDKSRVEWQLTQQVFRIEIALPLERN
jgi:LytS/YehU family sensor histidine kinase